MSLQDINKTGKLVTLKARPINYKIRKLTSLRNVDFTSDFLRLISFEKNLKKVKKKQKIYRFTLNRHTESIQYIQGIKAFGIKELMSKLSIILAHPKKILSKKNCSIFLVKLDDGTLGEVTCFFTSKKKWLLDVEEYGSYWGWNTGNVIFSKNGK